MRASGKHLQRSRVGYRSLTIKPVIHAQGEINVTPLIDVVLVLLIIFMVVTPVVEHELAVALPAEQRSAHGPSRGQLVVRLDDAGELTINERASTPANYVSELRALLQERAPRERVVFVLASDGVTYPRLVEAMDGAKRAGALSVGLTLAADGDTPKSRRGQP
jgi:biopolymer transport protein TolR